MPRVLEGSLPVLRAMADDEKVEVSVRTAADAKIEETEALLKRFEEPDKMFEEARDKARQAPALGPPSGPPPAPSARAGLRSRPACAAPFPPDLRRPRRPRQAAR